GDYAVVVSGACGEVTSSIATVRVSTKTAITTAPVGGAICPESSIVLSVTAAGEQLTYQWLRNNSAINLNGTSSTYTATQGGTYTVTVSGACGTATSTGVDVRVKTITSISTQPSSGAICPGSSQVLSVTAAGENLTYQWQKDGSNITLNGTGSTYTATQAGSYTVVVSGDCGSVTSSAASIRIKTVTSITSQPVGGLICPGNQKTLTVVAAGEGLTYQWQKEGVNISQATSATYYATEAGNYQVVVTGDCGTVTSASVQVALRTATSITSQPIGADLCPGLTLSLSVTAVGDNITYQWKRDGAVITNATNSSYTATIAGTYTVDVVGTCGSTTSASAVLRFKTVTSITSQPTGATICPGSTQALSVQAVGEGLSYQWQKDGQPIALATSSIFSATDAGSYTVVVKGDCGTVTSSAAIITLKNATIINTQPVGGAICPGGSLQLSVSATGDNLSYQWKRDGVAIANATSSSYLATLGGNYTVDVKGDCDLVTSTAANLRIKTVTSITTQPVSGSICSGTSYVLSVVAAGENLTYQWRKDGVSILGATASTFSGTEIGTYTVTVAGDCGTVTSSGAGISFNSATTITANPLNRTITYGNNTSFSAQGTGTGTITYKWQVNSGSGWTDIVANGTYSNPTLSTLTLTKPSGINSGNLYQCVITGTCGFSTTTSATLTINKVAATVTAQNKTRVYGDADPDFTVTYGGFIAGETFETSDITGLPLVTTTATAKSSPGTYPINPALGTLSSYNYSFTYVSANLSITA
ncbi:MAG: MBG domain-containing protein, partial [Chitinophagaceae bacterium]